MEGVVEFEGVEEGEKKLGWLYNLGTAKGGGQERGKEPSAVMCYFVSPDGSNFRCRIKFKPYFFLRVEQDCEQVVEGNLRRRFEGLIADVEQAQKEDLDMKNHLSGKKAIFLKVSFQSVQHLMEVREELSGYVSKKKTERGLSGRDQPSMVYKGKNGKRGRQQDSDPLCFITELREYDVPYHIRFCIDENVRCGQWYTVEAKAGQISLLHRPDLLQRADPIVCAFDIETTKLPLQFPNADFDQIYMISYMMDKQGYLIVNRQIVSQHIEDFTYSPKQEYQGPFKVLNVDNEYELLRQWFVHMKKAKPSIFVTYNGDFFDWPFIQSRAEILGLDMRDQIGFFFDDGLKECKSPHALHMDCFYWVKRDSYLPQGSQSLKAVTRAKLGYNPVEVDPENMTRFAVEQPQLMATYSVSDAVATYYLYMTYVHPFIFSLSNIIPMPPDDVLRKGSGTLCESLLMVEAFAGNIICPNKAARAAEKFHKEHLLESETYIGGHVECLESGVFRADIPTHFRLQPTAFQMLMDRLDRDMGFALEKENLKAEDVENYSEVKEAIKTRLAELMDKPVRTEKPLIYHLDVSAMYPNIILTNRLQPPSVVSEQDCFACDFNAPGKTCLKNMEWTWRGETYALSKSEYMQVKAQVENESNQVGTFGKQQWTGKRFLSQGSQTKVIDRLKSYCQKVYKRVSNKPAVEQRVAGICQRENPFYVNTVQKFRDRRYEYKALNKKWNTALKDAKLEGNLVKVQEAEDMCILFDSLQLAHKCILNSFYGYVMRKGARWYSMEMAGVVTHTGAKVIQRARQLIEQVGKPLELDTDGIWCCLPESFPETYMLKPKEGIKAKCVEFSYPCAILNADVAESQTNHQYQDLVDPAQLQYRTSSRCSIEFEVDGPYLAMVLPASKEEDKLLKKRYAVFNLDRKLSELKGFELKRRGELKLVKIFQSEVFGCFLYGETLEECYEAVAQVANRWLDMLDTQGGCLDREELLDLISESSTMSKALDAYGGRKSCALTTAKRISEFLGDTHLKDKGLKCTYIIAQKPEGTSISERAIPVSIFSAEPAVACAFLQKWTKDARFAQDTSVVPDPKEVLDWDYYASRLGSTIQKIITIPAALQGVPNPVPRIKHPDWLFKRLKEKVDTHKQRKVSEMFSKAPASGIDPAAGGGSPSLQPSSKEGPCQPSPCTVLPMVSRRTEQEEIPRRSHDYRGWLKWRKRKWGQLNANIKKRRQGGRSEAVEQHHANTSAKNVKKFFQMQQVATQNACWQVLNLVPQVKPGMFDMWFLVDGALYNTSLFVPRKLYLRLMGGNLTCNWPVCKSNRIAPHSSSSSLLYECTVAEQDFLGVGGRSALLAQDCVREVFQSKSDLSFDAVVAAGCVCTLQAGTQDSVAGGLLDLSSLQMKSTADFPYLSKGALPNCAVVHLVVEGTKACIVLYMPALQEATVYFVEPAVVKEVSAGAARRMYQQQANSMVNGGAQVLPIPLECGVNVEYLTAFEEAMQRLRSRLRDVVGQKLSNSLLLLDGPPGVLGPSGPFTQLLKELPSVTLPRKDLGGSLDGLQWKSIAARKGFACSLEAIAWFHERLDLANYACIPAGAFEGDALIYTADVLFARRLREAGMVSWASDTALPDLGGGELDDQCSVDLKLNVNIVKPGLYRGVVVEIRLSHLDVDAVCNRSLIEEAQMGSSGLEQFAACDCSEAASALNVLKGLVEAWLEDATKYNQTHANNLLLNLYRWVCSPLSRFHDPLLQVAVKYLMGKALVLLVAEIEDHGLQVVYADSSTLLVYTKVQEYNAALDRVKFALTTVRSREQFSHIHFEITEQWKVLLFKDLYNYGGVHRQMHAESGSTGQHEESLAERNESLKSCWTLISGMSKPLQRLWVQILSGFIRLAPAGRAPHAMHALGSEVEELYTVGDASAESAEEGTLPGSWDATVGEYLTGTAFHKCVEVLSREIPGAQKLNAVGQSLSKAELKASIGADMDVSNKYLAALFEMLRFEKAARVPVEEFCAKVSRVFYTDDTPCADESLGVSPICVLCDVTCTACGHVRSIDMRKDSEIRRRRWQCAVPDCKAKYDMHAIETTILDQLERAMTSYMVQDVRCSTCAQVGCSRLDRQCQCGGKLLILQTPAAMVALLRQAREHAELQNFPLLQSIIDGFMQQVGDVEPNNPSSTVRWQDNTIGIF
eukprot:scaffold1758_cov333-Pavlova_lutheri.AAC.12